MEGIPSLLKAMETYKISFSKKEDFILAGSSKKVNIY
jgi:hypothetical protein